MTLQMWLMSFIIGINIPRLYFAFSPDVVSIIGLALCVAISERRRITRA